MLINSASVIPSIKAIFSTTAAVVVTTPPISKIYSIKPHKLFYFTKIYHKKHFLTTGRINNHDASVGVLNHSDSGSQYTSKAYKIELARHHALQSISGVGKCYDNARMESFFATLKKEKLYRIDTTKLKMEEVKKIVRRFVVYYNRRRITTMNPNGYPPVIYRQMVEASLVKSAA
ncbi:MAG: integrase core domain-containing protein [Treponema sp.]